MMTQVQSCVRVYVFTKLKKDDSKLVEVFFFVCVRVCASSFHGAVDCVATRTHVNARREKKNRATQKRIK
jgi:hypothetical protein